MNVLPSGTSEIVTDSSSTISGVNTVSVAANSYALFLYSYIKVINFIVFGTYFRFKFSHKL